MVGVDKVKGMSTDPDVAFGEFMGWFFFWLFVWCAVGCIGGAIIGHFARGKPGDGAIWGLLLGPLGVLVFLAMSGDIREKCPACLSVVPDGARKCRHCGESI